MFTLPDEPIFSMPLLFQIVAVFSRPVPNVVVPDVFNAPPPPIVPDTQSKGPWMLRAVPVFRVEPIRRTSGPPDEKVWAAVKVCVVPLNFKVPKLEPVKLVPLLKVRAEFTSSVAPELMS